MGFIPVKSSYDRVGEWTKTKMSHTSCGGTFTVGSEVKIIGASARGYDIEDEHGNRMYEIGFEI